MLNGNQNLGKFMAIAALGWVLTAGGEAISAPLESSFRSKQRIEGLYTDNLEAAQLFQQGVSQYKRNNFGEAERALREAVRFDPRMAIAYYLLGNSLLAQNRMQDAIAQYQQATDLDPNLTEAYYNLGIAFYRAEALDEAAVRGWLDYP